MSQWLKDNMLIVLMSLQILVGSTLWVSSLYNKTSSNDVALVTVNARLDRIFEKLDGLPVMAEQLKEARESIAASRGDYASLEVRLRTMENNIAAVHGEATEPHRHQ